MTADLIARLPEMEREAQEHERKAKGLRMIIDGVRALNGDAERLFGAAPVDRAPRTNQYRPEDGPRGRAAVRQIVSERPGTWRVGEIKRQIQLRGWPSSTTGVEVAIKRMVEAGEAQRVRKGVYRFPTNGEVNA